MFIFDGFVFFLVFDDVLDVVQFFNFCFNDFVSIISFFWNLDNGFDFIVGECFSDYGGFGSFIIINYLFFLFFVRQIVFGLVLYKSKLCRVDVFYGYCGVGIFFGKINFECCIFMVGIVKGNWVMLRCLDLGCWCEVLCER